MQSSSAPAFFQLRTYDTDTDVIIAADARLSAIVRLRPYQAQHGL
jgi:hypothetical protein